MWITRWIENHPDISTIIYFITVIGFIITLVAFRIQLKERKRMQLSYSVNSNILINDEISSIDGVDVLYQNKQVNTIVVSNIRIWNSGNNYIDQDSLYEDNNLTIEIPENESIMSAVILDKSDDSCDFNIEISPDSTNRVNVSFYCIEPTQYVLINVYHTNTEENPISLKGRIKGGKIIKRTIEYLNDSCDSQIIIGDYFMRVEKNDLWFNVFNNIFSKYGIRIGKKN